MFVYCHEMVRKREWREKKNNNKNGSRKEWCDNPIENDDSEANVSCGGARGTMRRNVVGDYRDLTIVECEDTHGHVVCDAEQLNK
jgi:hypothetical protein